MNFSEDFYTHLYFANGSITGPVNTADIKTVPLDFQVEEVMNVEFSGQGEHIWLQITKIGHHTDQVAKSLAKLAGIQVKDVGFSGMKDFKAKTSQWFSVCLPGVKDQDLPDWNEINSDALSLNQVCRHHRKLKRGTHEGNSFEIVLRNFQGEFTHLETLFTKLCHQGVPNYFGEQRFGRQGSNLHQAHEMLSTGRRIKQRQKRSMLLSAARSWLFNLILSERLKTSTWLLPYSGEPLNLAGSKQIFIAEDLAEASQRIENQDVHTTAPLWGLGAEKIMQQAHELSAIEEEVISSLPGFKSGLEREKLDYARRSTRCLPENLKWELKPRQESSLPDLQLSFFLPKGQFATSVLREIVQSTA